MEDEETRPLGTTATCIGCDGQISWAAFQIQHPYFGESNVVKGWIHTTNNPHVPFRYLCNKPDISKHASPKEGTLYYEEN